MTKFCKDCKHCHRSWGDIIWLFGTYRYAECKHPMHNNISPVDGKPMSPYKACQVERKDWGMLDVCGPDGKYFEAKK